MADKCYLQKRCSTPAEDPRCGRSGRRRTSGNTRARCVCVWSRQPNLMIREGMATDVLVGSNDDVEGVRTFFGMEFRAPAVVLTTGTFMSGQIWVGRKTPAAGRAGEAPSEGLTESLVDLGFETDRLKTGTPARVDSRSIDYSRLEAQPGDEDERWFSFDPRAHVRREQMACHLTRTTAATHQLIRDNLHETPTYGGWVGAKGPRYCPSIEDKIVRFADKERTRSSSNPKGDRARRFTCRGSAPGCPSACSWRC